MVKIVGRAKIDKDLLELRAAPPERQLVPRKLADIEATAKSLQYLTDIDIRGGLVYHTYPDLEDSIVMPGTMYYSWFDQFGLPMRDQFTHRDGSIRVKSYEYDGTGRLITSRTLTPAMEVSEETRYTYLPTECPITLIMQQFLHGHLSATFAYRGEKHLWSANVFGEVTHWVKQT